MAPDASPDEVAATRTDSLAFCPPRTALRHRLLGGDGTERVRIGKLGRLMGRRSRLLSGVGTLLPPALSLPLRARFGRSREPELAALPQLVHAGDIVIDAGAHKGVYTYRLAQLVGAMGQVIAYEPQPDMAAYLTAASTQGVMHDCVELRDRALSDHAGTATLSIPAGGPDRRGEATLREVGMSAATYRVQTVLLDEEPLPGRIAFIKVDVEGHELAVLCGGRSVLKRDQPALLIEIEHRHAPDMMSETARLLVDELGYTAKELGAEGTLVDVARIRWDSGETLNRRPDGSYVNNFFFLPAR